ncbi:argonaute104 [Zea mays]|uniref:Argonaute104 n=1 Tax=Zea mays TaxID=4577 RepID=A0A1D6MEL6_MAIZE|nr:argonaute104 [Zea mays]
MASRCCLFYLEMGSHDGEDEELPPPPPVPPDVIPIKAEDAVGESPANHILKPKRLLMDRPGIGRKGQPTQLYSNHFKVAVKSTEDVFFHYYVNLKYEDDRPVDGKGIGRKVIDKLQQTYRAELSNKDFAYDGEKSLFTVGGLPQKKNEFTVVLEDVSTGKTAANGSPGGNDSPGGGDRKRVRRPYQTKTFKVEINFAAEVPMSAIGQVIRGEESENSLEALRVLDIILRQHSAEQGCLLVKQSFFYNNPSCFVDLGGGVMGCRGFHSSFRGTQSGLSLNVDVSTTMIVKPGPVIDFLLSNQNVNDPSRIDWQKAKRALKGLRIRTTPANSEFKIFGLSERICKEQTFPLRQRNGSNGDCDTIEITVYDYYAKKGIDLKYSGDFPCINTGKAKRPTYFPIEALQRSNYDSDPMLRACGVSVAPKFTQVEGRILQAPKLKAGNGDDIFSRNGRWNFTNRKFYETCSVNKWAVVNFSARCDVRNLIRDLMRNASAKGIQMEEPFDVFEESPSMRRAPVSRRVDDMFGQIKSKLPGAPRFLLCLLPERKNCEIYGPWKRKCLAEFGIVTQCLAPLRVNDPYLLNLLMKINAKLGGLNSLLQVEASSSIPHVSQVPTIILGMDVSHGHPGQDRPSVAAVVSSRQWPLISRYRASVHTQSARLEMMSSLFKPRGTDDDGLIRESLIDFYTSSGKRKPEHIIIFRDGVSESQFTQVINIELDQIIEACKFLDEKWSPKFTVIVAQKNHHTKFFQTASPDNVLPGTVVDSKVCHPKNFDFYMCAHAGMIVSTRGARQPSQWVGRLNLKPSCAAQGQQVDFFLVSVFVFAVAPVCYAHLAAAQVSTFLRLEEMSDASSSQGGGHTSAGSAPVPELPRLHDKVRSSMFFC